MAPEAEVAVVREVQNNSPHFDPVRCYDIPGGVSRCWTSDGIIPGSAWPQLNLYPFIYSLRNEGFSSQSRSNDEGELKFKKFL